MNGIFNLNGFENMRDDDLLSVNINESFDNFSNMLNEIRESTLSILSQDNISDEEFNEATAISKKIKCINDKKKELSKKISDLITKRDKCEKGSTKYKEVNDRIKLLNEEYDKVKDKASKDYKHQGLPNDSISCGKQNTEKSKKMGKRAKDKLKDKFDLSPKTEEVDIHTILKGVDDSLNTLIEAADVSVPIPGGLKESPNSKPYDSRSLEVPKKTEITVDTYNDAISQLKKTFKEAVDIMSILESSKITEKSVDQRQNDFMEDAISTAMLESFENGPIYEAVSKDDKNDIKAIVRKIRPSLSKTLRIADIKFYEPSKWIRLVIAPTIPNTMALSGGFGGNNSSTEEYHDKNARHGITSWWTTRFWQILGALNCEGNDIKDVCKHIEEEYSDILGDYKILYVQMLPSLADMFRTKFNWKQIKKTYFILVDKSVSKDLKKALREIKVKDDKDEVKTESVEYGSCHDDDDEEDE